MEFEQRLREKLKKEYEYILQISNRYLSSDDRKSYHIADLFSSLMSVFEEYYRDVYPEKTDNEIMDEEDRIDVMLEERNLRKFMDENPFDEDEERCIKCTELTRKWIGSNFPQERNILSDVLLRKMMIKMYGQEAVKKMADIAYKRVIDCRPYEKKGYMYLADLFSGEKVLEASRIYEQVLDNEVENAFNYRINCGGYALRVDDCVFPFGFRDFSKTVSTVIERYPFVRLLGDKPLEDDEYLVIYRATDDGLGHHFVRVDDDDVLREKEASNPTQDFRGWDEDYMHQQAVFAVKKESARGFDSLEFRGNRETIGLNFEETVGNAISNEQNAFTYHGHNFSLKRDDSGEIIVISDERIVADVIAEDGECAVGIRDEQEGYVENLQPSIPLIIKGGKLQNRAQLIKRKQEEIEER